VVLGFSLANPGFLTLVFHYTSPVGQKAIKIHGTHHFIETCSVLVTRFNRLEAKLDCCFFASLRRPCEVGLEVPII
jgi:hypothetical protein